MPQPLLGVAAQRWGLGRIIVVSLIWSGLFMRCISLAGSFGAVLALVGLGGIGGRAFHPTGSMSVASIRAGCDGRLRRGAAMSPFSVGGNLRSTLSPAIMAVALGLFGLLGTAAAMVVGLGSALLVWQLFATRAPGDDGGSAAGGHPRLKPTPKVECRDSHQVLPLALIVLFVMARSWFQLSVASFLPAYTARTLGSAVWPLVLLAGSVEVGSPVGGRLSDRIGRTRTVLGATLGATLPVTIVMAQER